MRTDRVTIWILKNRYRTLFENRKEMQKNYEKYKLDNSILASAYKDLYNYYDGRLEELESVLKILGIKE